MHKFIGRAGLPCWLAAILSLTGHSLRAEETPTEIGIKQAQVETETNRFTEQQLDAFAAAYVQVAKVYDSYAPRMDAAANAEEAYRAHAAITDESYRIILQQGLTPGEYDAVVRSVNENPRLARTVANKIHALQ
jgi:hypothetical protein